MFGPEPGSDRSKGCRCEPCREANRAYARQRDRASRRPDEQLEAAYIDAGEVRAHLRFLAARGVGRRQVSAVSGVAQSSLAKLRSGKVRRCRPATAEAILAVFPIDAADGAYVPAGPTWKLLDDLLAHGWTRTAIARALGSTAKAPAMQLDREFVTARNARAVKALHASALRDVVADRRMVAERQRRSRGASAA